MSSWDWIVEKALFKSSDCSNEDDEVCVSLPLERRAVSSANFLSLGSTGFGGAFGFAFSELRASSLASRSRIRMSKGSCGEADSAGNSYPRSLRALSRLFLSLSSSVGWGGS